MCFRCTEQSSRNTKQVSIHEHTVEVCHRMDKNLDDVMSSGYAILPGSQQLQSLRRHQLIQSCRNRHQRSICSSSDWGACTAGLSLALSPWGRTGKGGHNQDQEQCFRMSLHQGILPLGVRDTRPSDLKEFELCTEVPLAFSSHVSDF